MKSVKSILIETNDNLAAQVKEVKSILEEVGFFTKRKAAHCFLTILRLFQNVLLTKFS